MATAQSAVTTESIHEALEQWKADVIAEVKKEINKAKQEILEGCCCLRAVVVVVYVFMSVFECY